MKIIFLYIETQKETWAKSAQELYVEKISRLEKFEIFPIKSPSLSRENKNQKIKEESKSILSKIKQDDYVVLFDERGKPLNSLQFSKNLENMAQTNKRLVFLVGGAFGVGDEVVKRANMMISLSPMVMNHHVATTMTLEQIYRALTIIKGIPYHNS